MPKVEHYKKLLNKPSGLRKTKTPKEFSKEIMKTIERIEQNINVMGLMYFRGDIPKMCTLPRAEEVVFMNKLPAFSRQVQDTVKELTATINAANPIVDRIMDDDSVEGVIMTNKEGAPILTNVSVTAATNLGRSLHKFGMLSQMYIKELDPREEIIILRIHTKKNEIMVAPDSEFSIIVVQHARPRHKVKDKKGKEK